MTTPSARPRLPRPAASATPPAGTASPTYTLIRPAWYGSNRPNAVHGDPA